MSFSTLLKVSKDLVDFSSDDLSNLFEEEFVRPIEFPLPRSQTLIAPVISGSAEHAEAVYSLTPCGRGFRFKVLKRELNPYARTKNKSLPSEIFLQLALELLALCLASKLPPDFRDRKWKEAFGIEVEEHFDIEEFMRDSVAPKLRDLASLQQQPTLGSGSPSHYLYSEKFRRDYVGEDGMAWRQAGTSDPVVHGSSRQAGGREDGRCFC